MRKDTLRKSDGFTLLEALVSLAIIGTALPFLVLTLSNTSRTRAESEDIITASHLLRDKLCELEAMDTLPSGQTQGEFAEGARFQWQASISPADSEGLYDVAVIVGWVTGGQTKQLAARTYMRGEAAEGAETSAPQPGAGGGGPGGAGGGPGG